MRNAVACKRVFNGVRAGIIAVGLSAMVWMSVPLADAQSVLRPTATHVSVTSRGSAASFEVKVNGTDGSIPSGTVSLWSGETPIAAAILDANGVATYTAGALPSGTRQVTASYSGDPHFAASISALTPVFAAAAGVPSFTLAANPPSLTLKAGAYGTTVITVSPSNFNQNVTLSCSGLPLSSSCTFSPVNVLLTADGNTAAISTLNIQTQAASGTAIGSARRGSRGSPMYAVILPGAALLAGLGLLRKRAPAALRMLGVAILLVGCSLGLGACAARYNYFHKPPSGNTGTTLGTSTIVISGSGVSSAGTLVTATTQITLTVN